MLEHIDNPADLKKLNQGDLEQLAQEIRQFILKNVALTGGHLASNLGVVELTIALHYVYNSPEDKIIWDVGHQCYVHKILTSRREQFHTLRQYNGLSGFPKRGESPHDIFETGHSSTSISAALGIVKARDLKNEKYNVLAVIGDGALTGGMAWEALNNAGRLNSNLTVILNDNEMSIAPNVGAMAAYLSKIRSNPRYKHFKRIVENVLRSFPLGGNWMAEKVEKMKNSLKYLLVPGVLFEELGYTYIGPVDGHDLSMLIRILNRAKQVQGPVLVHVVTRKGKGYIFSESDPSQYHGVSPFDIENGFGSGNRKSKLFSKALGTHLAVLADSNPAIAAITAAMPDGTGLSYFKDRHPHRFFDVGIAEQHAVTFAAGLAANGMQPVVAIYSTFLQRAYDQILHDVCRQNLPVIFAIDRAGLVGEDGDTHHGVFDISYLRHIPNITIMAPKNTAELQHMLEYSLQLRKPAAIRYPKDSSWFMEDLPSKPLDSLNWEVLSEGRDIAILAVGSMIESAFQAAEILEKQGISPAIINARIIKPIDNNILEELIQRNICLWVTMEDNVTEGGFGSSISEYAYVCDSPVKVLTLGIPGSFIQHGSVRQLKKAVQLDPASLAERISTFVRKETLDAALPKGTN
ncbi:MAG TPA: 1-deoxy-D-xylulose-5-phosphate synthase [Clostridiales bacterium]|nr:1-deoxy-D-xylulose-5-phosphate synthase [Clostridiales bacterium]